MAGNNTAIIELVDLTKKYGDFTAVDRLNLQVAEGEVFGLLGPNGAGKTTTILMMLGLTEPTAGKVTVAGFNSTRKPLQVKRLVGYLPDNVGFYEELTARENLHYTAALNGIPRREAEGKIDDLLEQVGLTYARNQKAGSFSRGMRQRLGIADVLIKSPRLVILDEPTLGIDPDGVRHVLDVISQLSREQGITVLLSSHLLHQVQQVCDRVGIFVKGRLVAAGPISSLGQQLMTGGRMTIELGADPLGADLERKLTALEGVGAAHRSGDLLLLDCSTDIRSQVAGTVMQNGSSLLHLRLRGVALEDIYMKYFGEA